MVLQTNHEYGARSFIWGKAEPGELITLSLGSTKYQSLADAKDGSWSVQLNPGGGDSSFDIDI